MANERGRKELIAGPNVDPENLVADEPRHKEDPERMLYGWTGKLAG